MTPRQERRTPIAAPLTTFRDRSVSLPAFNHPPCEYYCSFLFPDSFTRFCLAPPLVRRPRALDGPGEFVREYWHLLTRCPLSSFIGPGQLPGRQCPKLTWTLLGSTDHPVGTIRLLNSMFSFLIHSSIAIVQPFVVPICPCPERLFLKSLLWLLLRSTDQSVSTSISRLCFHS